MSKNNNDLFDLTQLYDLDERSIKENNKSTDDITEILGYDFLEEEKDSSLNSQLIDNEEENIEDKSLVEVSNENNLQNRMDVSSEREENDLNILNGKVFNFENMNIKNVKDFLEIQTGKIATIEMIIGDDRLVDKIGMILAVGEDFILLKETQTGNILVCPLKNIEFIRLNY